VDSAGNKQYNILSRISCWNCLGVHKLDADELEEQGAYLFDWGRSRGVRVFLSAIVLPQSGGIILGLLANFGTLYLLQKVMKADIERFKADNNIVQNANWFGGCLIGLVVLVLFVGMVFVMAFGIGFLSQILGVPIQK
jgi:hypothetical protein